MTVYAPGAAMAGGKSMRQPGPTVIGRVDEIGPFTGGGEATPIFPVFALSARGVMVSHSWDGNDGPRSVWQNTMARTNGLYYFSPYSNQSRNGDQTNNWVLRFNNALVQNPDFIGLSCPTNDFQDGVPYATTKANYITMIEAALAAGVQLILIDNFPANMGVANQGNRVDYNTVFLPSLVAAYPGNVAIADLVATGWDPTNPAQSYDTIHPTGWGAYILAGGRAAVLNAVSVGAGLTIDQVQSLVMGSVDSVADTMFKANINTVTAQTGTSGTVSSPGTGSNYTAGQNQNANTGVTQVLKAPDDPDPLNPTLLGGERAQRMDLTGTSNSSANDIRTFHTQVGGALVAGDFVETLARVKITATDGVSAPVALGAWQLASGTRGRMFDKTFAGNNATFLQVFDNVMRDNPWVIQVQSSSSAAEVAVHVQNAISPDIRVLEAGLRWRLAERRAYGAPFNQAIPGDGGAIILHYATPLAAPASGAAGTAFSSTPGDVSGGGWYADSPSAGSITYQWKLASDNSNVSTGTGFTTRTWTTTGVAAGQYYCAITWTNAVGTITVNSNNITVS